MSRDDLHLQPCSESASLRAAFPQGSAHAVHAIGVRAQAPMDDGAPVWPCPSPAVPDRLTEREMEVFQLMRGSLSRREIATEIGRSLNTIKTQTQAIYRKLGVSTRSAAITRARSAQVWPGPPVALLDPLTEREMEVLQLLRGSLSRREIATEVGRSLNTIKTQTQAIYRKLGVSTRSAAITRARFAQVWPGPPVALLDPLTEREMEVLQLLRGSLSRREIATEVGRSLNTIKTQTQAIYRKLGVSTRSAAIARALDTGILPSRGRVEQGELDGEEVVDDVQCLLWGIAALGSSGSPSI